MNDSMSILLATTILALGGLGLYMFKSSDENDTKDNQDNYDEGSLFGGNFWGSKHEDEDEEESDYEDEDESDYEEEIKPRKRNSTRTQKNRKSTGTSRRRY